ncbi:MAG: peptide chain release factor aRF-1 [Nanoarchaeota archaeon]|nr:peptide chain release factor aRF-1 [Nanoarchaeota archaeon]
MVNQQKELKKLIKRLEGVRGRHTELVTVYVPAGYKISDISTQLRNEQGTAINIKSKAVRKNVTGALDKIIQHLKLYKETPENGLALFSGNVSENEGVTDIDIWAIEPPEKLNVKLYWCDQTFELAPLRHMMKEKEVYGLLVMDTKEATLGMLRGKNILVLKNLQSIVPGKAGKGGQSQQRYERVRNGLIHDFYKVIGETVKAAFSEELKGIIIGGPGPSKNDFHDGRFLEIVMKKKILGIKDVGYTDEHGLQELVEKSQDILAESAVSKEKELVKKFFFELQSDSGKVTYGVQSVLKALEIGAVDMVLISEDLEYTEIEYQCSCGSAGKKFIKNDRLKEVTCQKCSQPIQLMGQRDIVEAFEELVTSHGTEIEVISRDTREGEQLYQMGGIGAILRYKL